MEKLVKTIGTKWRRVFTMTMVLIVFVMPGSRSVLGKFVTFAASKTDANNKANANTASPSSNSAPSSGKVVSPVKPPPCSTGRQHTHSHHNHHKNHHPHYRY